MNANCTRNLPRYLACMGFVLLLCLASYDSGLNAQSAIAEDCPEALENPFAPNGQGMPGGQPLQELREEKQRLIKIISALQKDCRWIGQLKAYAQVGLQRTRMNKKGVEKTVSRLSREGGINIPLPTACNTPLNCCPGGDCCSDLDPCSPESVAAFQKRLRCMSNAAYAAFYRGVNSMEQGNGLNRHWYNGTDHRHAMEAYHAILSGLESMFNIFDQILSDLMRGLNEDVDKILLEELIKVIQQVTLDDLKNGASAQERKRFQQLKANLHSVKNVKEALKIIHTALKKSGGSGRPDPTVALKLKGLLFGAAANAASSGVTGWQKIAVQMSAVWQHSYQNFLCAEAYYQQILQALDRCGDLCEKVIACHQERLVRIDQQIDRQKAAARKLVDQVPGLVSSFLNEHVDEFCWDLCEMGYTAQNPLVVPTPHNPLAQKISALLRRRFGQAFCFMKIRIYAICDGDNCTFELAVAVSQTEPVHRECCHEPANPPRERPISRPLPPNRDFPGGSVVAPAPVHPGKRPGYRERIPGGGTPGGSVSLPGHPGDDNPDNCRCTTPRVTANGAGIRAGWTIRQKLGSRVLVEAFGDCIGGACTTNQTRIWVTAPGAAASIRYAGRAALTLDRPGRYRIFVQQVCGPNISCPLEFFYEVTPAASVPSRPVLQPGHPGGGCGTQQCVLVHYQRLGGNAFVVVDGTNTIDLIGGSDLILKEEGSFCDPGTPRSVRWEIKAPDGKVLVKTGPTIQHRFDAKGRYIICVRIDGRMSYDRTIFVRRG